jgi:hypothetical protein
VDRSAVTFINLDQSGHIQVSINLINWTTLTNFTGNNTTLNFRDPAATNAADCVARCGLTPFGSDCSTPLLSA